MSQKSQTIQALLIQQTPNKFVALKDAIAKEQDIVLKEMNWDLEQDCKPQNDIKADVIIFYCPSFDKKAYQAILGLSFPTSRILLLTEEQPKVLGAGKVFILPKALAEADKEEILSEIIKRIRLIYSSQPPSVQIPVLEADDESSGVSKSVRENYIIAIGASTGGTEALAALFQKFPSALPGIVVVQHMPPVFTKMYADRLNDALPFEVTEATHNTLIKPGTIHIAPGGYQMEIRNSGNKFYTMLGNSEKYGGHCPSVDVLFNSVAKEAKEKSVGIILTGMGADGAEGLLNMKKKGAFTIGQDEKTCVVYGMPRKAFELGAVSKQAALLDIPAALLARLSKVK